MTVQKLITVGAITRPHGLKGEVKVFSRTDFPEVRFAKGSELLLQRPEGGPTIRVRVKSARPQQAMYIVQFEEYSTVEEAESLRGYELKVTETDLVPLPEGEFYIHQLVGCRMIADTGETLGELVDVLQPGANDVYVIRAVSGKELLLPAIPDCILHVDVEKREISVHILPGLLD
ncbi:ribosome maturation factor RimM [Fodinisporobacter ferrooxydans]|uniref:Ribosome maturation factor RimM n=1 Tax=Fodinisporobacter ferrooxydans TaxID=2901836 RepID=A0ABY4CN00_9BACL|nr:ribosome maturation factor RimM [Alicyclobacillaceae bacterium MYW30-H2]